MFMLAVRSLRRRVAAFTATFLAAFLGAVLVMAFGSLSDTGAAEGVAETDRQTLSTMSTVVGGWSLVLVAFAVTSTLTLSVRQRATEMALLKCVGATPAQLRRMVLGEALLLALAGALVAIPAGALTGRALLALLKSTDQVADGVPFAYGPVALGAGIGVTVLGAAGAAFLTARRVARMRAVAALGSAADAGTGGGRLGKGRIILSALFLAGGVQLGVMAATAGPEGFDSMQFAGSADILFGIGLAGLAPMLVRGASAALARPVRRFGGASGYLAVLNLRQRTAQLAAALTPVILFVGIGVGTLWMQAIQNDTSAGAVPTTQEDAIETLNFVVTGMIVLFTCIMLINTLVAATTYRRREFGQQRLAGATRRQVLGMVVLEGAVLTVAGLVCGTIAALPTVLPFSYAKTDDWLPDPEYGIWLGTVAVAVTVTMAALVGTARRTLRTPAVEAVSVAS
ncbi:ABC transporter permease [Phytohabitans sp. ZYX-F-186]|uniref:ABC transporter permease n=1 Tax=Phytohabitans maris TaxID=3071409 RepID=A0ABU0ZR13_9ACTN|nr:ABC transporter permease [Phytohabitans sp. ZYX-F-186]MDQ7908784.1 ABC transporter permease [Phytohabitans sp. ZYX-F-186]